MAKGKDALDEFLDGLEEEVEGTPAPAEKKPTKKAKKPKPPADAALEAEIDEALADCQVSEANGAECVSGVGAVPVDPTPPQDEEVDEEAGGELVTSPAPPLPRLPKERAQLDVAPQVVARTAGPQSATDPSALITAMLQRTQAEFDSLSANVLEKWEGDRAQLENVIQSFISAMGDDPNNAARPIVEGLVSLLETKVNSGMVAVKLMDTKIKLLAALKGGAGVIINQNIAAGGTNSELTELLSNPPDDDLA